MTEATRAIIWILTIQLTFLTSFRAPNKTVIASPPAFSAGAAISGFEIASSASPPRNDEGKGVLLGALSQLTDAR